MEGAGLGMEKEVPVVAGRSAEGERPGLSLESWAGLCYASWQPGLQVQEAQASLGHGTNFFDYLNLFVFNCFTILCWFLPCIDINQP